MHSPCKFHYATNSITSWWISISFGDFNKSLNLFSTLLGLPCTLVSYEFSSLTFSCTKSDLKSWFSSSWSIYNLCLRFSRSCCWVLLPELIRKGCGFAGCLWSSKCQNLWLGGCDNGYVPVEMSNDCQGRCPVSQYGTCHPFFTRFLCCKEGLSSVPLFLYPRIAVFIQVNDAPAWVQNRSDHLSADPNLRGRWILERIFSRLSLKDKWKRI